VLCLVLVSFGRRAVFQFAGLVTHRILGSTGPGRETVVRVFCDIFVGFLRGSVGKFRGLVGDVVHGVLSGLHFGVVWLECWVLNKDFGWLSFQLMSSGLMAGGESVEREGEGEVL